ncbi:MAG: nucleoside hydrolase [Dysgonamonadaceae bacterium]|jgi:inosine-uridine nucleoside N-ribohydrolase|nr:nucleoside hydrolase [Dysgonamonadaceae bacterium]
MKVLICLFTAFFMSVSMMGQLASKGKPVPLIFDTDMGPDYDDVGALTLLHALADKGEVRLLATVSSNMDSLAAPCIDVINTYFGRANLPIGATKTGVNLGDHWHKEMWTKALSENFPHQLRNTADAPDAVTVYRQILAKEKNHSVVIVTVGFLTNLAALLDSPPDKYSKLNGKELVRKKVKHLVSMAGCIPSGREFNVFSDAKASQKVFSEWNTPIIISNFEIGANIFTGKRLINSDIENTPAKTVFSIAMKQEDFDGRSSWDQTAVLIGVRGTKSYFGTVKGKMIVADDGSNTWQDDKKGSHEYLTWKMPKEELTKIIEDLMMHVNNPIQKALMNRMY